MEEALEFFGHNLHLLSAILSHKRRSVTRSLQENTVFLLKSLFVDRESEHYILQHNMAV
jgi:hypothetical protein